MYNGSNDYGVKKLTPSETIVSRTLQSRYRSFSNVVWRTGKPALDSEWNLINDMASETLSSYIQAKSPSGWLDLGKNTTSTYVNRPNTIQFYSQKNEQQAVLPNAVVNGWPVLVGGVGYSDTSLNSIALHVADTDSRYDFIFLEVWRAQLRSRDTNNNPIAQNKPDLEHIYKFGNVQFGVDILEKLSSVSYKTKFAPLTTGAYKVFKNNVELTQGSGASQYTIVESTGVITFGTSPSLTDKLELRLTNINLVDDIVDTAIKPSTNGIETSQRVQIQYRIRTVSGVVFANTDSDGFEDIVVQGQGANLQPQIAGYSFINMKDELGDCGLWRAGAGDQASMVALGTVDGYSYAIPMFKIYRRSIIDYNDTGVDDGTAALNQQGNAKVISDLVSDRPDNKFHDAVDVSDIIDLRNKVVVDNMQEIIDKNLDKLFSGKLLTNRLQSLFYDSISNTDIPGYTDFLSNMGASGKRTYWSDAATKQSNIFAEVKTTTTDNSLDVYRATGTGNWAIGNTIKVKTTAKIPIGTVISATPRIYLEDKTKTDISSKGTWSGLGTNEATFTLSNITGLNDYDIWIYYDMELSAGQGISHVPDEVLRINYVNYSAFPSGSVVRGMRLEPNVTRFQDLFDHPFENKNDNEVFAETSVALQRKQIKISPLIQTTTTRNGGTRTLEVETLDRTAKTIYVPHELQHLRGVYTAASSGTELAMQSISGQLVSAVDDVNNQILIDVDNFVGTLTSLKYDPTGAFVGSEIELLIVAGGSYGPVFEHKVVTGEDIGTRVSLYTSSGVMYDIPTGALATHFKWSGKRIKVRQGSNYGYDLNNYIIDCKDSDNNALFTSMADRQQLWIDCDYLGAAHSSAELRLIYKYSPYQGSSVGNQELELIHKRERGFFFNNGTGGGVIDTESSTGTSNFAYSPLSPRLPGSFEDYLRDGTPIVLISTGNPRYDSDFWTAAYDLYGYLGGSKLWSEDFTMPSTPEITQRGFLSAPMLDVIFEEPAVDSTNAEFIFPTLVRNKMSGKIYLMIQIGNKGIHKEAEGLVLVDLFNLDERILLK